MASKQRLVIVANRLPVRRVGSGAGARWEPTAGGLVTAMEPVLRDRPGAWVGWT
jgi:trehalose 6-phosphate synthase